MGHSMRSPLVLCSIQKPPSTVKARQQPLPVAPFAPSAEPSRVPPPRQQPSAALGSLFPKSLILATSRGHTDLVTKMLIGNQLLLRLLVSSCIVLYIDI